MKVLLIGSGGREHAMARALKNSKSLTKLYCSPGNPGIFEIAEKADINPNDFSQVSEFCRKEKIDLVAVGPEAPLAAGIADRLASEGIKVFGPSQKAAKLESSKDFAKEFMARHSIPTASYSTFSRENLREARRYIDTMQAPIVLKADGLAAGKGVIIAETKEETQEALGEIFGGLFKDAGNKVVIEEFLEGEEASILAICDGKDYILLAPSQDHKRALDGDKGPNTGGMGAYAPAPIVSEDVLKKVESRIIKPAVNGMAEENTPFTGCLYAGLMIDKNGDPYVVEFNVRFGDPETQAVLSIFKGDFAGLLHSAASGNLDKSFAENVADGAACCVVLASDGYPGSYEKGFEIRGIDNIDQEKAITYHAGTELKNGALISSGGRVLGVTGKGGTLKEAIQYAYAGAEMIEFENKYYRKDIGEKGLRQSEK